MIGAVATFVVLVGVESDSNVGGIVCDGACRTILTGTDVLSIMAVG